MTRIIRCIAVSLLLLTKAWAGSPEPLWQEPNTGMMFVAIPKGCFQMGWNVAIAPPGDTMWGEIGYKGSPSANEKPQHEVCIDAFWLGRYEVSVKEWQAVMGQATANNQSDPSKTPMAGVTWQEAQSFAQRLGALSGKKIRLPTEAEWEYACRAGSKVTNASNLDQLLAQARFGLGSPTVHERSAGSIGALAANSFGLHDMLGNVWEWVADSYEADGYARHSLHNPSVESASAQRVIRGGSFRTEFTQVRCSRRGHQPATESLNTIGLRLVRQP